MATSFRSAIAFLYPAYMSYKTLETDNVDDHVFWCVSLLHVLLNDATAFVCRRLGYWIVFGVFSVVDGLTHLLFGWCAFRACL